MKYFSRTLNVYYCYEFHIIFEETIFTLKNILLKFKPVRPSALEMSKWRVYFTDRAQYISGIVALTDICL